MALSAALRNQLTAHIAELERQISNLSREIERQSGGLLDQRDAAVDLRQRLKHLMETSKLWSTIRFQTHPIPMTNILDGCAEEGPLLTPALSKPKTITKAQIQRCISKLSPRWTDKQLKAVVSMFKEHGLL